jgi:hypothetical protein
MSVLPPQRMFVPEAARGDIAKLQSEHGDDYDEMAVALIRLHPSAAGVGDKLPVALSGNGVDILYHTGNQWTIDGGPFPQSLTRFNLRDYVGLDSATLHELMELKRSELALEHRKLDIEQRKIDAPLDQRRLEIEATRAMTDGLRAQAALASVQQKHTNHAENHIASLETQLAALGGVAFAGKHSFSHMVWDIVSDHNNSYTMSTTFRILLHLYTTDAPLKNRLRQFTVIPYHRKGLPDDMQILYAKADRVPQSLIRTVVDRVRVALSEQFQSQPRADTIPVSRDPLIQEHPTEVIEDANGPHNQLVIRRKRGRSITPPQCDPLDAALSVPPRKGAPYPRSINLVALIAARPAEEQTWAAADVLCNVGVGVGFVSAFSVLQRMMKPDMYPERGEAERIGLLEDIQRNPFTFQNAVAERCQRCNTMLDRMEWLPDLMRHPLSANVSIRPHETMEVWRWDGTCASQQSQYALCHKVYEVAVHFNPRHSRREILERPPRNTLQV